MSISLISSVDIDVRAGVTSLPSVRREGECFPVSYRKVA
jgi:hypothetical protein